MPKPDRLDDAFHYSALVVKLIAESNYRARLLSDPLEYASKNDLLASAQFAHLAIRRAARG